MSALLCIGEHRSFNSNRNYSDNQLGLRNLSRDLSGAGDSSGDAAGVGRMLPATKQRRSNLIGTAVPTAHEWPLRKFILALKNPSQPEDVKYDRTSPRRSTSPSYAARCQRSESPPLLSRILRVGWGISTTDLMVGIPAGGGDSSTSGDHMRAQK